MRAVSPGEVWMADLGLAAKVRPALLLTGNPALDELDLVTVVLHTTSLRGNRWELNIPKPFLKPGAFHLQQVEKLTPSLLASAFRGELVPPNPKDEPASALLERVRARQSP